MIDYAVLMTHSHLPDSQAMRGIIGFPIFASLLVVFFSGCVFSQRVPVAKQKPTTPFNPQITDTAIPASTLETETIQAISSTSLPSPCATPSPDELKDFINNSITIEDSGKTFVTHVTSRFWIYLDDSIYPLRDLLNSAPDGLIGYISNGSIRGPQCYPVMFEAVKEGKGLVEIKDFQLSIIIDNNLPMSRLPLH
jgi:hypothetical protein